jgi:hypothetical protein
MPIDPDAAALDIVRYELNYRRQKQWDIFKWTVTIFLAVIGGAVTLASRGDFTFAAPLRLTMCAAIVVIAYYAVSWIDNNIDLEREARSKLPLLLAGAKLDQPIPDPKESNFGYTTTARLVAIGAIVTVLIVPTIDWCSVLRAWGKFS